MNVKKINKIKEKSPQKGEKQELPPPQKKRKRNKEHEKPQTNKHQTPL